MTDEPAEPLRSLYRALLDRDEEAIVACLHADADHTEILGEVAPGPAPSGLGAAPFAHGGAKTIEWISVRRLSGDQFIVNGRVLPDEDWAPSEFAHFLRMDDGAVRSFSRILPLRGTHPADPASSSHASEDDAGHAFTTIDYSVSDGVAEIRLNRPQARNAIDFTLSREFLAAAQMCAADSKVRAILLSGAGDHLTVGGDITYFTTSRDYPFGELLARMTAPFHEGFRILSELEAPLVTAAQGSVAGGGLGFVYAADIVLVSPEAVFITAFSRLGVSGDGGGTWYLPRLVGHRRAAQMYLQNIPVKAGQAIEWGLATELVERDELLDRARGLARTLAQGPTRAYGAMRSMLRRSWSNDLSDQLLEESVRIADTGSSRDAAEGVAAFGEKRPPAFTGE